MIIERIVNKPITSNCFVLFKANHSSCLIIDPGSIDNSDLMEFLERKSLVPEYVVLTHEHFDHISGVQGIVDKYGAQVVCSSNCGKAISDKKKNLSLFHDGIGFEIHTEVKPIEDYPEGLLFLNEVLEFAATPGHTNGSICIFVGGNLFCGDLMILNQRTVTKLPGGSKNDVLKSIKNLYSLFGGDVVVHSGHGDSFEFSLYYNSLDSKN